MGLLDSFEKGLERAVNSAFAKTFRSGIQPVEIASALRRELDVKASVVSRDRILAPNSLTVRLSPADDEKMRTLGPTLGEELDALVQKHAKAQGYSFAGPVAIAVRRDEAVPTGTIQIDSRTAAGQVAWRPVVEVEGRRHPITKARTVIGRGSDADITISDAGTSRKHVEILWDGERGMVRDLGSTNGSTIDGRKFSEAPLTPDSTIRIGRTDIVFKVIAQATPARPPLPAHDATQVLNHRDGGLTP